MELKIVNTENKRDKYKGRYKEYQRNHWLMATYGITTEEYNQMLVDQDFSCGICGKHMSEQKVRLHVDHDHSYTMPNPKAIRGLLCSTCNTGIGGLQDNIELLESAVMWLKNFEDNK